jgi:hypothetical protein
MGKSEKPPIIDAEFEDVTSAPEKDRRPFWQRYEITFDWKLGLIVGALSAIAVVRSLQQ